MLILTTILLALHLLAVNVATAGPLACVWLRWRARRGDVAADRVGHSLAKLSLAALLAGVVAGTLSLGLLWPVTGNGYAEAVGRFPPRAYVFAGLELLFSFVCLWIYAGTWQRWQHRPWLHGLVAVVSATNLLYHLPPLMTVLSELAARPHLVADATIAHNTFRRLMVRPDVLAHVAHFALASVAVSGWVMMEVARRGRRQGSRAKSQEPEGTGTGYDRLISGGAWIALAASLAQLAVGLWVLVELSTAARRLLLGDDWLTTGLFFAAIVASFALLHLLAVIALGETSDVAVRRCRWLMIVIVALMVGTLTESRRLDAGDPTIDLLAPTPASTDRDPADGATP